MFSYIAIFSPIGPITKQTFFMVLIPSF